MRTIIIAFFLMPWWVWGSGGFDNGTATGKGKLQLDLTWNPFNKIYFGQSYAVMSYGLTNKLDLHGYISSHPEGYQTLYGGIFYQFLNAKKLHLATAVGIRRRLDRDWTHVFIPQILYTLQINKKLYLGGSFVTVMDHKNNGKLNKLGVTLDFGFFYNLPYKTKRIEKISFGIGGFHPTTWEPKTFFLPTYSLDIKFRRKTA